MKEIKLLVEHIEDELEDAKTYAELALKYKDSNPEMAQLFYKLSGEELTHQAMLHNQVVEMIAERKRMGHEPPAAMAAVYDFMHKRFIEEHERIINLQNMFRK